MREYDFLPDLNNIFIRSIDEDKDNRFLIFFCGVIPQNILNAVKAFISFTGRGVPFKRAEEKEYKSAVNPFCKRYVYSPVKKRRRSRTDF